MTPENAASGIVQPAGRWRRAAGGTPPTGPGGPQPVSRASAV